MHDPATNMPLKCHIFKYVKVHILHSYVVINISYELSVINNGTKNIGKLKLHIIGISP